MGTVIGSIGMSDKGQKVLEEALALPPEDRADRAATLIESLDEKEDEAVEEAWAREIQRRMREVESGAAKTVSVVRGPKADPGSPDARTKS